MYVWERDRNIETERKDWDTETDTHTHTHIHIDTKSKRAGVQNGYYLGTVRVPVNIYMNVLSWNKFFMITETLTKQ